MSRLPSKDFKVAVVGGGMCGLLCAIGLVNAGIRVEVFEQAPKFGEIGAGVGLGPNALIALDKLGVLQAVLEHADEKIPTQRGFRFVSGLGTHEHIYDVTFSSLHYLTSPHLTPSSSDFNSSIRLILVTLDWQSTGRASSLSLPFLPPISSYIDRPAFLEALTPMLDPNLVHFNSRCESVSTTPSGSHVLHFMGGNTCEVDLVIGADGIKSSIRNFVADGPSHLAYSHTVAYRAVVATETLETAGVKTKLTDRPLNWIGQDKHVITFPIQGNKLMNIVVFSTSSGAAIGSVDEATPWVEPATQEEILQEYSDWGPDVITMLKEMKNPSKWRIHMLNPPLPAYFRQRVVLVGDAAHAMLPHLGAGVGQGFEDVFTICSLLGDPRTRACDIDAALGIYNSTRVPRASMVHMMSKEAGDIYETRGKAGGTLQQIREQLVGIWEPVWHWNLVDDVNLAVESLHRTVACL